MPRAVTRCPARSGVDHLDSLHEWHLVHWTELVPGTGFRSLADMRAVWNRHRDAVLGNVIRQRPGTRPFCMYVLGELPMPPLKHEPREHSLRVRIDGTTFYSAWHYFGTKTGVDDHWWAGSAWGEFQYLRGLGVIDDAEARRAEEWIDDRYYDPTRSIQTYKTLAD